MKVVIELPDDEYEAIKYDSDIDDWQKELVTEAIKDGTPLPKGHKRLIAEPTEEDIAKTIGGQNDFAECIRDSVKAVFDNALTIIEAESED